MFAYWPSRFNVLNNGSRVLASCILPKKYTFETLFSWYYSGHCNPSVLHSRGPKALWVPEGSKEVVNYIAVLIQNPKNYIKHTEWKQCIFLNYPSTDVWPSVPWPSVWRGSIYLPQATRRRFIFLSWRPRERSQCNDAHWNKWFSDLLLKYEILWICAFSFLLIKILFEQDKASW